MYSQIAVIKEYYTRGLAESEVKKMSLEQLIPIIPHIITVGVGVFGTVVRWAVQYYRDKESPVDTKAAVVEGFIGGVAAFFGLFFLSQVGIVFPEGTPSYVVGALLGYNGIDIVENIFVKKE